MPDDITPSPELEEPGIPGTEDDEPEVVSSDYDTRHKATLGQLQTLAQRVTGMIGTDRELSELVSELFVEGVN